MRYIAADAGYLRKRYFDLDDQLMIHSQQLLYHLRLELNISRVVVGRRLDIAFVLCQRDGLKCEML